MRFCTRVSYLLHGMFGSGIDSADTPRFFIDVNHISPIQYGAAIMMVQSFHGQVFTCTDDQLLPGGSCPITTGRQALVFYKFDVDFWPHLGGLVATTIAYRLVAYTVVKLARLQFNIKRGQKGTEK
jgi:hypothetical protein